MNPDSSPYITSHISIKLLVPFPSAIISNRCEISIVAIIRYTSHIKQMITCLATMLYQLHSALYFHKPDLVPNHLEIYHIYIQSFVRSCLFLFPAIQVLEFDVKAM
jgi:hypothetical protein